nr:hypothetical protein [Tanacetum cinerariifolium]
MSEVLAEQVGGGRHVWPVAIHGVSSDRYGIDPRLFTSSSSKPNNNNNEDQWYDCATYLAYNDEEFPTFEALYFFRLASGSSI